MAYKRRKPLRLITKPDGWWRRRMAFPPPRASRRVMGRMKREEVEAMVFEYALLLSRLYGPYGWSAGDLVRSMPFPISLGLIYKMTSFEYLRYRTCVHPTATRRMRAALVDRCDTNGNWRRYYVADQAKRGFPAPPRYDPYMVPARGRTTTDGSSKQCK